jgi:hypothetical protein
MFISDINDCEPNPCLNSGTCTDGVDTYTCACVAGYTGPSCEISRYFWVKTVNYIHINKYYSILFIFVIIL